LGLLLFWALAPWLFTHWFWLFVLCSGLCGLVASVLYLGGKRRESAGVLSLTETGWRWRANNSCSELVLKGELVVWPGLIILPFKERFGQRRKILVLLSDSGAPADLRHLRVWLRTLLPRL
jgi:hypothetical protein